MDTAGAPIPLDAEAEIAGTLAAIGTLGHPGPDRSDRARDGRARAGRPVTLT